MRDKITLWWNFYDPASHNDEQQESLVNLWEAYVKLTSILMAIRFPIAILKNDQWFSLHVVFMSWQLYSSQEMA